MIVNLVLWGSPLIILKYQSKHGNKWMPKLRTDRFQVNQLRELAYWISGSSSQAKNMQLSFLGSRVV